MNVCKEAQLQHICPVLDKVPPDCLESGHLPDSLYHVLFKRIIKNITKIPHAINIRLGVMGELFTSKELQDLSAPR